MRRRSRPRTIRTVGSVLAALLVLSLAALTGPAAGAQQDGADDGNLPVPYSPLAAGAGQITSPGASPPGANDFDCEPTQQHPDPVVLVHGLGANQTNNWQTISPLLTNEGYCVFALTYGVPENAPPGFDQVGGLVRMQRSAAELGRFIDHVQAATGAEQVDIVGHSEGSLMPNYYVKFLDGAEHVDDYVGITPLWDGTSLGGAFFLNAAAKTFGFTPVAEQTIDRLCDSCRQFLSGSDFLRTMNSGGGPAADGVDYTMILTRYDQLVVPYSSGFLNAPNATNVVVQDKCTADFSDHVALAFDPVAAQVVLNALDPDDAQPPPCRLVTPLGALPGP